MLIRDGSLLDEDSMKIVQEMAEQTGSQVWLEVIKRRNQPHLTANQAWTVIWWLGNKYWQVTDRVERCNVCGALYHSWEEGDCLDYGKAPYNFCDNCMQTDTWLKKAKRNPDKSLRP